jgi:hypothetical protein
VSLFSLLSRCCGNRWVVEAWKLQIGKFQIGHAVENFKLKIEADDVVLPKMDYCLLED